MVPASIEPALATANTSNSGDVPCKITTATFSHWNVRFTMALPLKNIRCSGENHLITSIVQCLGQGHLLCRDCHFTPSPAILPKEARCPLDGSVVVKDNAETRSLTRKNIPCPSVITFESGHKPACTWQGPYQDVKCHLDECTGIPDSIKLKMQNQQIRKLQEQLRDSEKKQRLMQQSLKQGWRHKSGHSLPLLSGTVGDVRNAPVPVSQTQQTQTGADQSAARAGNMEQPFRLAVPGSFRQFAFSNLSDNRYLSHIQRSTMPVGRLSPVESPDNTDKCVDVFLWRIDGFNSWLEYTLSDEGSSYYSPAFYTTDRYCVSGQIYPYKHDRGGCYLGVYIAVWKGQYDEQMSWPMNKKITLSLVNQNNPPEKIARTFVSVEKPSCFQKPQNLVNKGWGYPKFLSLEAMKNSEIVKNNSLHMEIKLENPSPVPGASEGQ